MRGTGAASREAQGSGLHSPRTALLRKEPDVPTEDNQTYWDSFYGSRTSREVPADPSAFAAWVQARLGSGQPLVELGFGTARDSLWFARQGHPVTGFDFAPTAVRAATARALEQRLPATFAVLDLDDVAAVKAVAVDLELAAPAVYGRFLIHSLSEAGRASFFDFAAAVLAGGGELYLEFRTGQDRDAAHLFGDDHFRVYLDLDRVSGELESRGATIAHAEAGHGLAVYRTEDPHVARVVATWVAASSESR